MLSKTLRKKKAYFATFREVEDELCTEEDA